MLLFTYGLVIPKLMKLPSHVRTRTVYHESNPVTCSEYKCCFFAIIFNLISSYYFINQLVSVSNSSPLPNSC